MRGTFDCNLNFIIVDLLSLGHKKKPLPIILRWSHFMSFRHKTCLPEINMIFFIMITDDRRLSIWKYGEKKNQNSDIDRINFIHKKIKLYYVHKMKLHSKVTSNFIHKKILLCTCTIIILLLLL
uniref:Uncharacterized protein n=1 Tax=Cacopsylla melanoneura TaxID=428564 RepID=A0A8D8RGH9_9HEMI